MTESSAVTRVSPAGADAAASRAGAETETGPVPVAPTTRSVSLSPAGRGVAVFAAATLVWSWATEGALVLYAAAGVALLAVVPLLAWLHTRGLRVLRPAPVTAFAGETFPLDIPVVNTGHVLALRDVVVLLRSDRRDAERPAGYAATIAPRAHAEIATAQRLLSRGRHESLSIAVETAFPLGLAVCRMEFMLPADILVLPRLGTVRNLDALTAHRHGLLYQGATDRGDEQEFHGMREWREGESQRRVHWKLSARRGRLLVREFRGEDRPPVHIVLDARLPARKRASARASERRGIFERAVSLAATLVEQNLRRQHLVRMTIVAERSMTFERRRGRAALFPILQALAEVEAVPLTGRRSLPWPPRTDEITLFVCAGGTRGAAGPEKGVIVLDVERRDVARMFVRSRPAGSMTALGRRG